MPELNIVYYDPFNPDEEAYVAEHYCDGQRKESITEFYKAMREWRIKRPPIPHYEASDMAHYPDMAYAGPRAGIFAWGMMIIRNYQREYWQIERGNRTMKVQTVTVECHEKRNHPTGEYSHFDSRVSLTAQIDEGENADIVVAQLQYTTRQQVAIECDRWVNDILTSEAQERARTDLQWIVGRLENRLPTDNDLEQFEKKLAILPGEEHAEWRAKLKAAQGEFLARIKGDLDRIVEKAGWRQLSPRETSDFDDLMVRLPEGERQAYIDRISDAMQAYDATKAAQIAQSNEIMGSSDKEEVPF